MNNKQEKGKVGKAWNPRKPTGNCGNFLGLKEPVSTIVYLPLHFNRVGRSSVCEFWLACKIITVYSQLHCQELLLPKKGIK